MRYAILFVLLVSLECVDCVAAENEFTEYNKDIYGETEPKATSMYGAWARNMAHHIKRKQKKGIVINKPSETNEYSADGVGNVVIKDGARVNAPIIVEENFNNSTIIRSRH